MKLHTKHIPEAFAPVYYFYCIFLPCFCCSAIPAGHDNLFRDIPQMNNPLDTNHRENEISDDDDEMTVSNLYLRGFTVGYSE